ncbi:MAG: hypothetical protein AAF206_01805 [Bacteroidota bacterium]
MKTAVFFILMGLFFPVAHCQEHTLDTCSEPLLVLPWDSEAIWENRFEVIKSIGKDQWYQISMDAGICGTTRLRLLINEEGEILCYQLIKEVHPILTRAITNHLPDMKFWPGEIRGVKTTTWITLTLRFGCGIN